MTREPGKAATRAVLSEGTSGREPARKVWRVIHACEYARDVLPVIETQIAAGMRPFIVTPQGAGSAELYLSGGQQENPRSLSLLREWQDVRNWRKSILDCNPEFSADVVHGHSFAAGMAAVRNCSCVVYDVTAYIEELAIATSQCEPGSWMARSFRVAEQFILARAGAVVVHSRSMAEAAQERGSPKESVFVIPEPLPVETDEAAAFTSGMALCDRKPGSVAFFVPDLELNADHTPADAGAVVLQAFATAAAQLPDAVLIAVAEESRREAIIAAARQLSIENRIQFFGSAADAWCMSDVAVVTAPAFRNDMERRRPSTSCVEAMARGKAVIAADTQQARDVTPDGRGCLWYQPDNSADLAARMAFVGQNPTFPTALGQSGRTFLQETRSPATLGRQYEEAYRYAASRRRPGVPGPNAMQQLVPATQIR